MVQPVLLQQLRVRVCSSWGCVFAAADKVNVPAMLHQAIRASCLRTINLPPCSEYGPVHAGHLDTLRFPVLCALPTCWLPGVAAAVLQTPRKRHMRVLTRSSMLAWCCASMASCT